MTNLFIIALTLLAGGKQAAVTYYTPVAGTVYADLACSGEGWRFGWVNKPVAAGTNTITMTLPCGAAWIRLKRGA